MMKISRLIEVLEQVKADKGDADIGLKMTLDDEDFDMIKNCVPESLMPRCFIREITGISFTGFEGLNITCDDEDE